LTTIPAATARCWLAAVFWDPLRSSAGRHDAVFVAIGDNRVRAQLFTRLSANGEVAAVAEHPRSIVAEDVLLGAGSMVSAGAVINTGSAIGVNTIVNTGATVDHHASIGDHVHIAPGVHLGGEVRVGDGALIGIGAVVLPRITVGAWSTVGAGAVVTCDVPAGVTVAGVPARPLAVSEAV
jgi:sugar O-acyltransferase (sialic acid O-acetyltransferase NeuD family)